MFPYTSMCSYVLYFHIVEASNPLRAGVLQMPAEGACPANHRDTVPLSLAKHSATFLDVSCVVFDIASTSFRVDELSKALGPRGTPGR